MPRLKDQFRHVLIAIVSGRHEGLSRFGLWLDRLARYLIFVIRDVRQEAKFGVSPEAAGGVWRPSRAEGVVYDIGANNGDDTAYYLSKGMKVVAIEANPALAEQMAQRFSAEVASGDLIVLNVAVTDKNLQSVAFYVHRGNDKVSSTIAPDFDQDAFTKVEAPAARLSALIRQYGEPFYVKIDVEGADAEVLADMFSTGLRPQYVSAEALRIEVLCELVHAGYRKFKVIEGKYVDRPYYRLRPEGASSHLEGEAFAGNSAGPFGEDIPGPWVEPEAVFRYLSEQGLGWKDIHASR